MEPSFKIQFEKPNLSRLTRQFTVVDLHFHTHYSDGMNTVGEVADRAAKLGIGIAITDHNEIRGAVEMDARRHVLSIPGIEVTSSEGTHILVYFYGIKSLKQFYANDIEPFMGHDVMSSISLDMEEIIRRARAYRSVIISPHPYCAAYTGIYNLQFPGDRRKRIFELIDGVEVINSENLKKWNLRCAVLGFNLDKSITGGSDGHSLYELGRAVSYSDCTKSRKGFLDAVKNHQTRVIGKEIHILRKVRSSSFKIKTNFKNYPDLVEKNLKYSCTVINSKSKRLRENVKRSINQKIRRYG
jgi:predicted metal-dependent phosphoesterase TrpH